MLNLNALSIPGVDLSPGTVTLSLWAAGVVAVLALVLLAAAIFRAGAGAGVRVVGVAVAVVIAWAYFDRAAENDRAEERRALDQRLTLLTAQTINAESILGCLDPNIGETVASAREKALFAAPETVATATAYVAARSLLEDGGSSLAKVLKCNVYCTSVDKFAAVNTIYSLKSGCPLARRRSSSADANA